MSDIFISYASSDIDKAKILADVLARQGWSVWWDREIPAGKTFASVIEKELDISKCVVVLWSKASIASHWVQTEASEGLNREIIVPALIEEVKIPLEFRRIQAIKLVDWQGQQEYPELNKLIRDVEKILGIPRKIQGETKGVDSEKGEVLKEEEKKEKVIDKKADLQKHPEGKIETKPVTIKKTEKRSIEQPPHKNKTGKEKKSEEPTADKVKDSGQLRERSSGRKVEGNVKHKHQADKVSKQQGAPTIKSRLPWLLPAIIVPIIIGIVVLVFINRSHTRKVRKVRAVTPIKEKLAVKEEIKTPVAAKTKFRSTSQRDLSVEFVKTMLKDKGFYHFSFNRSSPGFTNDYKLQNGGKVVFDRASGLTWQQSGSDENMNYEKAKTYINKLNSGKVAGYSDWRLPTLEEAMSLMEPTKKNGVLKIDSVFDKNQEWIWTSDLYRASKAWVAHFYDGDCENYYISNTGYVRAVR